MHGLALIDGLVYPMTAPDAAPQEAILWAQDRVILVGPTRAIEAEARRRQIPIQDLAGKVVLPGFVDAHTHFLHVGVKKLRPDLRGAKSKDEALARLEEFLRTHPGHEAVIAEGWDESEWSDASRPTMREIDDVVRRVADELGAEPGGDGVAHAVPAAHEDRPVVMRRICGHIAVANSAAVPPIRSHFGRGAVEDDGLVVEAASLYLNEVLPVPPATLDWAVQEASREAHRLGVTAVGDYSQAPYRAALQRAAESGTLTVRVASSIYVQQLQDEIGRSFKTGRGGEWIRDGGLKVFLDGSLGGHTAHLREPYLDGPPAGAPCSHGHPRGTAIWSDDQVRDHFQTAHAAGIQVHAHAIGDAAIDQGLEAYEQLAGRADWRSNSLRHRFEHFEIHHDDQVARTARLGIVSSSQPNFVGEWSAKGGMYQDRLGDRFHLNNRFQTVKRAGIALAFGSDGMPFGPLIGLQSAIDHPEAAQRLGIQEAIWHYTERAAWSLHWDGIGSLAPGHFADLIVLDRRALDGRPAQWRIAQTYTGGIPRLLQAKPDP